MTKAELWNLNELQFDIAAVMLAWRTGSLYVTTAAADGQVVHGHLPQDPGGRDDEEAPQRDARVGTVLEEDAVVTRHLLGDVRQQGVLAAPEPPLAAGLLGPRQVAELAVDGAPDELGARRAELLDAVGERRDLRGAHEGEVERVEEQDQPLAREVPQRDLLEAPVGHHRGPGEAGRRALHLRRRAREA